MGALVRATRRLRSSDRPCRAGRAALLVCRRQQPQVYGVEMTGLRRKGVQLGVTIDVALANLDEPGSSEGGVSAR